MLAQAVNGPVDVITGDYLAGTGTKIFGGPFSALRLTRETKCGRGQSTLVFGGIRPGKASRLGSYSFGRADEVSGCHPRGQDQGCH